MTNRHVVAIDPVQDADILWHQREIAAGRMTLGEMNDSLRENWAGSYSPSPSNRGQLEGLEGTRGSGSLIGRDLSNSFGRNRSIMDAQARASRRNNGEGGGGPGYTQAQLDEIRFREDMAEADLDEQIDASNGGSGPFAPRGDYVGAHDGFHGPANAPGNGGYLPRGSGRGFGWYEMLNTLARGIGGILGTGGSLPSIGGGGGGGGGYPTGTVPWNPDSGGGSGGLGGGGGGSGGLGGGGGGLGGGRGGGAGGGLSMRSSGGDTGGLRNTWQPYNYAIRSRRRPIYYG